ncbi:hypothetical protein ABHA01_14310 [Clostridium paraputrificum]|uniref:hypothetical protein n=1 Tax=Clostridium paraputrificum TaxID=29363 RepID=UPI00325BCAA3
MSIDTRKKITTTKIRDACNQLVYVWKRKYETSIKKNTTAPSPITIPQIAKKANIAPKTIYTNEDYKSIALTAIAKTTLDFKEEQTIDFYISKESYSKQDVQDIIKNIKTEYELKIKEMISNYTDYTNEIKELKSKINKMSDIINKQNLKIANLELENCEYKATLKFYDKNLN